MPDTMPPRIRSDKNTPLFRWRIANELTLAEAAKLFGLSVSGYRKVELLKRLPTRYELALSKLKEKYKN
jgi:transcriptional regulator with XRE-family HTH domain